MKKYIIYSMCIMLCLSAFTVHATPFQGTVKQNCNLVRTNMDFDPLEKVNVTVDIKEIRSLEKSDGTLFPVNKLNLTGNPNFYVMVTINNETFTSPTWTNMKYVYSPDWSVTLGVPNDVEFVNVIIELWDASATGDKLCDISGNYTTYPSSSILHLQYSIATGHWTGDDDMGDPSGYGRACGCDDGSIYQNDRDCELWFDIHQNDFDGDAIPYWTEVNYFHTDPTVNNTGEDKDGDGVPIEWEFKWGCTQLWNYRNDTYTYVWVYNPNKWENQSALDPDNDGLTNVQEYLTSQWGSDPFRRDLFIEMDQMAGGPNGEPASFFPENAKELLRTAYDRQNIVYHLDDGNWVGTGSEMIPFESQTSAFGYSGSNSSGVMQIYNKYFLHGDPYNWRRGVFHYGVVIYQGYWGNQSINGNAFGPDRFQISSRGLNVKAQELFPPLNRDMVYASAYMHETGHTLAIENPGVDNQNTKSPWQLDFWVFFPYHSCMNYEYTFRLVDYSNGGRGKNDFNDWGTLNLTAFKQSNFP